MQQNALLCCAAFLVLALCGPVTVVAEGPAAQGLSESPNAERQARLHEEALAALLLDYQGTAKQALKRFEKLAEMRVDRYLVQLDSTVRTLTRQGAIDEASSVQAFRQEAQEWVVAPPDEAGQHFLSLVDFDAVKNTQAVKHKEELLKHVDQAAEAYRKQLARAFERYQEQVVAARWAYRGELEAVLKMEQRAGRLDAVKQVEAELDRLALKVQARILNHAPIANLTVGQDRPLTIIAGPCQIESEDMCLSIGERVRDRCAELGLQYIFKASFDKANRSSIHTPRGSGLDEGLSTLERIGKTLGVPTTTDIHEPYQADPAGQAVDLLQIPAFLCRQTDLLVAAAKTGRSVNVKKGQFLSPGEMTNVVNKLDEAGCKSMLLTERGTFFGYNRLVNDMPGLEDMMQLGWPVCFDVTHSTQLPGGGGTHTAGRPERAPLLARCAVAAGVQALFIETHPEPAQAKSDAATILPVDQVLVLLGQLARLHETVRSL
eukprot:g12835.t1